MLLRGERGIRSCIYGTHIKQRLFTASNAPQQMATIKMNGSGACCTIHIEPKVKCRDALFFL